MKLIFSSLLLGVVMGQIAACAPRVESDIRSSEESAPMKTDRENIVAEALRFFLREFVTPVDEVKIFYVRVVGEVPVSLEEFAGAAYRIKTGTQYEFQDGRYRDKESGQLCYVVALDVVHIEEEVAVVSVAWIQASTAAGGIAYQLRKTNGKWQIEKKLGTFAA